MHFVTFQKQAVCLFFQNIRIISLSLSKTAKQQKQTVVISPGKSVPNCSREILPLGEISLGWRRGID
jgi:hypothetical protein